MTDKTESNQCGWFKNGKLYQKHDFSKWRFLPESHKESLVIFRNSSYQQIRTCLRCGHIHIKTSYT